MPKMKKTLRQANQDLKDLVLQTAMQEGASAEMRQSAAKEGGMEMMVREAKAPDMKSRMKIFKEWERQLKENTKTRIWTVDLGGGTIAQVSTELINWGIRAAGRWSGDGWWARQNDLLQSLPHVVLGSLVYIAELATRADPAKMMPSATRAVVSEASKLFAQLGFSKLVAAVRARYVDGQAATADVAAMRAEIDSLKAKNKQLEAKPK